VTLTRGKKGSCRQRAGHSPSSEDKDKVPSKVKSEEGRRRNLLLGVNPLFGFWERRCDRAWGGGIYWVWPKRLTLSHEKRDPIWGEEKLIRSGGRPCEWGTKKEESSWLNQDRPLSLSHKSVLGDEDQRGRGGAKKKITMK